MDIKWDDRRPVSEIHPREVCGCGRRVRYISAGSGGDCSCNKYARCITWDELKAKYDALWEAANAFADAPLDRNTYTLDHAKRKRLLDVLHPQPKETTSEQSS